MQYVIDKMHPGDWPEVRSIYLEGIASGHATFESEPPDWGTWDAVHLQEPRLVVRTKDVARAWAALSPVSRRSAYSGVAELSLYVACACRGRGLGSMLLAALIAASERSGLWTLQGGVFPENTASFALVAKHGFRKVGRRERVGKMTHGGLAGTWRDVILVERRSVCVGVD